MAYLQQLGLQPDVDTGRNNRPHRVVGSRSTSVVYFERFKDEVRAGRAYGSRWIAGSTKRSRRSSPGPRLADRPASSTSSPRIGEGVRILLGVATLLDLGVSFFFMHPLVVIWRARMSSCAYQWSGSPPASNPRRTRRGAPDRRSADLTGQHPQAHPLHTHRAAVAMAFISGTLIMICSVRGLHTRALTSASTSRVGHRGRPGQGKQLGQRRRNL